MSTATFLRLERRGGWCAIFRLDGLGEEWAFDAHNLRERIKNLKVENADIDVSVENAALVELDDHNRAEASPWPKLKSNR